MIAVVQPDGSIVIGQIKLERPMNSNQSYFVMLLLPNGNSVPLMNNEDMAFFESKEDAVEAARRNPLGRELGFEIFELGDGVYSE